MSLNHEFLLLSRHDALENWRSFFGKRTPVILHDDVIGYIYDTLLWIPTWNPATRADGRGLNLDGPTVIDERGAAAAEHVFSTWATLLAQGPRELQLTGGWMCEPDGRQHYERLVVPRDETVQALRAVAGYAAAARAGTQAVLHLGI